MPAARFSVSGRRLSSRAGAKPGCVTVQALLSTEPNNWQAPVDAYTRVAFASNLPKSKTLALPTATVHAVRPANLSWLDRTRIVHVVPHDASSLVVPLEDVDEDWQDNDLNDVTDECSEPKTGVVPCRQVRR